MDKAKPKITRIYRHQFAELVKKFTGSRFEAAENKHSLLPKTQEENLVEARAKLARSLEAARAAYIKSGQPLLTLEEIETEIEQRRGEVE